MVYTIQTVDINQSIGETLYEDVMGKYSRDILLCGNFRITINDVPLHLLDLRSNWRGYSSVVDVVLSSPGFRDKDDRDIFYAQWLDFFSSDAKYAESREKMSVNQQSEEYKLVLK